MRPGEKHTPETIRRMKESWAGRTTVLDEDAVALRLMGQATVATYADRLGCHEMSAKRRLNKLVECGMAARWRSDGGRSYTYSLIAAPGDIRES